MKKVTRRNTEMSFGEDEVLAYAELVNDYNPIHIDKDFAAKTAFRNRIVFGALPIGFIHSLYGKELGKRFKVLKHKAKFSRPVFLDEKIRFEVECSKLDGNKFLCSGKAKNHKGETVLEENSEIILD